ncbi:MAG: 50S ribosomal protein L5 [Patescibacteria group bacterium]|nr:50S ribosomal protein L5 [Patescibacteria group bacterium]MDD5490203.1 50S ribosomal protein L5 [Patescibacteria group bacterium]
METKTRIQKIYETKAIPALQKKFGYKNRLAVPRIEKVTINVGINQQKGDQQQIDAITLGLSKITGQKPVSTKAKKSISSFKIRQGMVVGLMVTLRGKKMFHFIDKLVNVTLPRVRDFRGLDPGIIDKNGNLNIGFKENLAFPEVSQEEMERSHGLEVTITANAASQEEGLELFKSLGFPFKKD